jgi:protein-tyrosine-phosphatase/predicted ATP-grasp superfamily ATP-dependent carboligase
VARRPKVLVLGDDNQSFLATVRSLARHGIEVHVAPFDLSAPALKSNKITSIHWLPYYLGDGLEWLKELRLLVNSHQIELIIPCDERTVLPLDRYRSEFSQVCELALPNKDAIEILYDKHNTRELARSIGVPVTPGRLLVPEDTAQDLIDTMGLPLMLKARQSYYLDCLYVRSKVRVLTNAEAIARELKATMANRFIVESFFEGFGVGVSILAKEGRILQAFQHERIHESHSTGGSSYRLAVPIDHELGRATELILQTLNYTGLAMFEFRKNRVSGEYVLLEINARPWGSLPFPVALGVDFPFFWYELVMHNIELPRVPYRSGVYSRNVTKDLLYCRYKIDQLKNRPWQAAWLFITWLGGFWRYAIGQECWDALVIDDPRPGLAELSRELQSAVRRVSKWVPGWRILRRKRAKQVFTKAYQNERKGPIVFVCLGNICRSPFAAAQLERFLESHVKKPKVVSAGILALEGRSPPQTAILAARELGVDIRTHRSRHLSRGLAESARVLIVFDDRGRQAVTERYPDLKTVVHLGDLCGGEINEIHDPFGQDPATFRGTYAAITDCNHEVARLLSPASPQITGGRPAGGRRARRTSQQACAESSGAGSERSIPRGRKS